MNEESTVALEDCMFLILPRILISEEKLTTVKKEHFSITQTK